MQLQPRTFWRLSLAEWRAMLVGYADRFKASRREQAWMVSHLLIAAGCEPDKVTPAKLLGERERKRRTKPEDDGTHSNAGKLWETLQELGAARKRRVAEIGEEAVQAEEAAVLKRARDEARRRAAREG